MIQSTHLTFSIKEVSLRTGISSSALRIWEHRYDWPRPQRKANGYRAYNRQQLDDLIRVQDLLQQGYSISEIIKGGCPAWPNAAPVTPPASNTLHDLPEPRQPLALAAQKEIIDALHKKHWKLAHELVIRSHWQVHPDLLIKTTFLPTLTALMTHHQDLTDIEWEQTQQLRNEILKRCTELLHRYPRSAPHCVIVPLSALDKPLAACVTLACNQSGIQALLGSGQVHLPRFLASDFCSPYNSRGAEALIRTLATNSTGQAIYQLASSHKDIASHLGKEPGTITLQR